MIGDKKGIYHSTLVKVSPVSVKVTGDVFTSKFTHGEVVMIDDGGGEQTLKLENVECADAMRGLKGKQVTLTASGDRDGARIVVTDATGAQLAGTPAPSAPKSYGAPPADPDILVSRWKKLCITAMTAVLEVRQEWDHLFPDHPMTDQEYDSRVGQGLKYLVDKSR